MPPVVVFFGAVEKVVRGFSTRGGLASIWWTVGVRRDSTHEQTPTKPPKAHKRYGEDFKRSAAEH